MSLSKGVARVGLMSVLMAALLGLGLVQSSVAHAQNPPATYYGVATAGDEIGAWIDGVVCQTVTADANGEWVISIESAGCDGAAVDGAAVAFSLNGEVADQTATWTPGGAPADLVNGIVLTVSGGGGVTPPDTGNAGFAATDAGSSSLWLMLALGTLAAGALVGARTVTGRSR